MNPSSEDFINAFETLNADSIIVLPNNSNIYLAADQASKLYQKARVLVANTRTIAEGYSALTMIDTSCEDAEAILADIEQAASNVQTVSVTYAVRNGEIDGVAFRENDYICVSGKKLLSDSPEKVEAAISGLRALDDMQDKEVLTVICGKDVTLSDQSNLTDRISKEFGGVELFLIEGGQDVYSFIIAVE